MKNFLSGLLSALLALEVLAWALARDSVQAASVYSAPRYTCIRKVDYMWAPCWAHRWESRA